MRSQSAVNSGNRQGRDVEYVIRAMLESGINVFVLKWRKVHNFVTSMIGFEVPEIREIPTRGGTEIVHKATAIRGELSFEPDEYGVLIAYLPDTKFNRNAMALQFYKSPYYISSLITNTGTIVGETIAKEIEQQAISLGMKKPIPSKIRGVYGNTLDEAKAAHAKKLAPVVQAVPPVAKSVFKNEEARAQVIPAAPQAEVQTPKEPMSQEVCLNEAERLVKARFAPLIKMLQDEKKQFWRKSKYYKDVIYPELAKEKARLLMENGHPPMVDKDTADPDTPDSEAPQA